MTYRYISQSSDSLIFFRLGQFLSNYWYYSSDTWHECNILEWPFVFKSVLLEKIYTYYTTSFPIIFEIHRSNTVTSFHSFRTGRYSGNNSCHRGNSGIIHQSFETPDSMGPEIAGTQRGLSAMI